MGFVDKVALGRVFPEYHSTELRNDFLAYDHCSRISISVSVSPETSPLQSQLGSMTGNRHDMYPFLYLQALFHINILFTPDSFPPLETCPTPSYWNLE